MTRNQDRAVELAQEIQAGAVQAADLPEDDWTLLLLAAGLNNPRSLPRRVSHRVLSHHASRSGYFAGATSASRSRPRVLQEVG